MEITINQSINDDDIYVTGLNNDSRLHMFNVIKNDTTGYYFNIFKNYTIPDSIFEMDYLFDSYVVDNNDWWDNIAAKFYGTSQLWWLVCFANNIVNPYEDIYPGMIIKIFKSEYYGLIIDELKNVYKL